MIHPERRRESLKKIEEMDRANVIAELENIQNHLNTGYSFAINYKSKLILETLKLLKAQEAKQPSIMQDQEGIWSICSKCGYKLRPFLAMELDMYFPKFCSECGQKVKW